MKRLSVAVKPTIKTLRRVLILLALAAGPGFVKGQPGPAAVAGYDAYVRVVESRLVQQHRSKAGFLAAVDPARVHAGELVIEDLTPAAGAELPGALLHHWRGSALAPGAKAADFERLMRDFNAYPRHFSPEVMQAHLLSQHGDQMQAWMRLRQQHVIPVVMDTTYDITFGRLDAAHGYSSARSIRIAEIDAPGTARERVLNGKEEHGFLWRLNTYWSYEERDGGLYMQIETVSLTRSIPPGLGWAVRPFIESVPRESLEFTLRSTCKALSH